jgi:hypothetical protein
MDQKLIQMIKKVAASLENQETTPADLLAIKCAKALSHYPGDRTIGSVGAILEKMACSDKTVSRKELKDLYRKYYSNDSKFASVFAEELGEMPEHKPSVVFAEKTAPVEIKMEAKDQTLLNALKNAWAPGTSTVYSEKTAAKAKASVHSTLDSWNAKPAALIVDAGNENFIVLRAEYDTPKGRSSFFIPVETTNDKICQANYFVANDGHHDINYNSIKGYLTRNTGAQVKFAATDVLHMLVTATEKSRDPSDAEMALIRLNSVRNAGYAFDGQIYGQKVDAAPVKDVAVVKSAMYEGVAEKFASAAGQASFMFGNDVVEKARSVVARELTGLGHKNSQVAVTKVADNTVYFGVSLPSRLAFTVPVKIEEGKVKSPSVILCNGTVSSFDASGIAELADSDDLVSARLSVHAGLASNELLTMVKRALVEGNYEKAEDALNVLSMKDKQSYLIGLGYFTSGLSKTASAELVCDKQMMTKSSQHVICGHTGLPLHKTCKDKQGYCRPLHRQGQSDLFDTAFYSTSKILG